MLPACVKNLKQFLTKEKGKSATSSDCSSQVDTTRLFGFGFGSGCGLVVLWKGRVTLGDGE